MSKVFVEVKRSIAIELNENDYISLLAGATMVIPVVPMKNEDIIKISLKEISCKILGEIEKSLQLRNQIFPENEDKDL
jgi:hypothetical protein